MDWTATHAGFVIASYAASLIAIAALVFCIFIRDRRVRKTLSEIEKEKS